MALILRIDDERKALVQRVEELSRLIAHEWHSMSWQVATEREAELFQAQNRIKAIDRSIARRKR